MDIIEASAMTEASGLTNNDGGIEQSSEERPKGRTEAEPGLRPLHSPSPDAAMRWADQLRKVPVKAPLPSLFVAFLLGVWVARRR